MVLGTLLWVFLLEQGLGQMTSRGLFLWKRTSGASATLGLVNASK